MLVADSRIRQIESLLPKALARDREAIRRRLTKLRHAGGGPPNDGTLDRMEAILSASVAAKARRRQGLPPLVFPEALPITAKKDEIIAAIRRHPVVVVSGDTGSGKSTQIPSSASPPAGASTGSSAHPAPAHRGPGRGPAHRRGAEAEHRAGRGLHDPLPGHHPPEAYIKVMTDGILLAETAGDRMLSAYDTLIVDEAHERNLNIDFILGYLRTLIRRRRDLRVIITSATIDTAKFSKAFDEAPVIEVTGRTYPVEVRYEPPETAGGEGDDFTPVEQAVSAVRRIQQERLPGDILVFMPTEQDIRETCEMIAGASAPGTLVLPLFARLTAAEQGRVFHRAAGRKIVVATNVAENLPHHPRHHLRGRHGAGPHPALFPRTRTTAMPVAPISAAAPTSARAGAAASPTGSASAFTPRPTTSDGRFTRRPRS